MWSPFGKKKVEEDYVGKVFFNRHTNTIVMCLSQPHESYIIGKVKDLFVDCYDTETGERGEVVLSFLEAINA